MKKKLSFLLVVLFFIECTNQDSRKLLEFDVEQIILKNTPVLVNVSQTDKLSTFKLSEIGVTEIQYIPLATKANTLLSDIKILTGDQTSFYICDLNYKIIKYSRDGYYITQIGRQGRGPNEYYFPSNISVDPEKGYLCISSEAGDKRIYIFSKNGKFVKSISTPDRNEPTLAMACVANKLLCYIYNGNGNNKYSFHLVNYNGEIVNSISNQYKYKVEKFRHAFYKECLMFKYKNDVFVKEVHSDTVYVYNDTAVSLSPVIVFDFEGRNLSVADRGSINSVEDHLNVGMKKILQVNLFIINDLLYFEFTLEKQPIALVASLEKFTTDLINLKDGFINDLDGGPNLWFKTTLDDSTIVSWINTFELKEHVASEAFKNSTPKFPEKKKELEALANSLSENDNPVLMLIKLKE